MNSSTNHRTTSHNDEIQQQVDSVGKLLSSLDDAPADPRSPQAVLENRLIAVRLGIASSLFHALRVRHTPTACHSLRVAILCSRWSLSTDLESNDRDELEVAALLHDIGKIGTPDAILQKPGSLDTDEAAQLAESRLKSLQILSGCASQTNIPKIVAYAGAWFDGSRTEFQLSGNKIPIASRMIAIADAYDAMTTDRIYRKAVLPEIAIDELRRNAGTQFDPILVEHFSQVLASYDPTQAGVAAQRWLTSLTPDQSNKLWQLGMPKQDYKPQRPEDMFHMGLLDALPDGILYINSQAVIMRWNATIEDMTSISSDSITQTRWDPYIVKMRWSDTGESIRSSECPILETLKTGAPTEHQVLIKAANGEHMPVNLLSTPILDAQRSRMGVAVMFRDATEETNLVRRVETLHKKATLDPLTKLANRAEFDRFHGDSIRRHSSENKSCSLIICDIDRFKSINDTHGHQAGDAALISFSKILEKHCRDGDLVARYGGEEFVIVCNDLGAEPASQLADEIRVELSETPLRELNDQCITASFGVTELQPGDTMETMLRRADRGLLEAKDTGRNRVICLGSGMDQAADDTAKAKSNWWSWIAPEEQQQENSPITDCFLSTNTPVQIVSQKLRGYIADHDATILSATEDQVVLKITSGTTETGGRRRSERGSSFQMAIGFMEEPNKPRAGALTIVHASLSSSGRRDRRSAQYDAARSLIKSLKSYLAAQFYDPDNGEIQQ